jgi:tRNA nucleotidyltransferase (CCA-adding enzyme)
MKIYLVGGAVRDKILGIPVSDKDYLVVGSSPKEMVKLGFKPIGKDFPVFLHPKTKEEYALARTERKVGKGYHGFKFYTSPDVTLEEDLRRRDITINAIAEDEDGNIYDPFNGVNDIKNKIIRHVSDAFIEDPLRVLRVARFTALDERFKVQIETLVLMKNMVSSGELKTLSVERVVLEISKGLEGKNPDIMLHYLCECGALNEVFPGLNTDPDLSRDFIELGLAMKEAPQSLGVESKIIMLLLVPYFGKHYSPDAHKSWIKQQSYLLKHLKLSSLSVKIFMNIIEEELNLKNFLSLTEQDKLDCLYRLDFFRRPNIILEILNIIRVFYKTFEKMTLNYEDLNNFLARFANEINKLKSKLDNSKSGDEIKMFVYQERLSVLKKLVSN